MPLSENFSEWEHLQQVLIQTHNRLVREDFKELGGIEWSEEITTPRGSLRVACTMKDSDSAIESLLRMFLFYITLRGASDLHPPLYTIPSDRYQESIRFAPQVTLYFREDIEDVETGYKPIDAEISFRVKDESYSTFNEAKARSLATRIKAEFTTGGAGYRWRKGRTKLSYRKKEDGYLMSINAFSEGEGREVIQKVLSLQGDRLDADCLSVTTLATPPPIVPPPEFIYGQTRRPPRKKPVGFVRFRYAECHIWGISRPVTLVDATLRRANPLLRA